jgi:hypothetical protein
MCKYLSSGQKNYNITLFTKGASSLVFICNCVWIPDTQISYNIDPARVIVGDSFSFSLNQDLNLS